MGAAKKKIAKLQSGEESLAVKVSGHEELLRALNHTQAVLELSPEGQILKANEKFLQTFRFEAAEIVGRNFTSLLPQNEEAAHFEHKRILDQLSHGEVISGEYRRQGKNGKEVWVIASYH